MRLFKGLFAGMVLLLAVGCVSNNSTEELRQQTPVYRLKPQDPITVTLKGISSGNEITEYVINEHGMINLAYLGPVKAAGLTPSELQESIEQAYIDGEIYRQVTVSVTMYAMSYFIKGEVRSPGRYPLTTGTSLLQAIAAASDFTEYANQRRILLTRAGVNYWFDARELTSNPEKDLEIKAGDLIEVLRSTF